MTPGLDPLDGSHREGNRGDLSEPGRAPDDTLRSIGGTWGGDRRKKVDGLDPVRRERIA